RFAIETHDYASALAFVGTGTGVTVLPELGVRNVPPDVVVVPISAPTPTRTIVLCARRALRGHPGVERARELLLACAARADHERGGSWLAPVSAWSFLVRRSAGAAGDRLKAPRPKGAVSTSGPGSAGRPAG